MVSTTDGSGNHKEYEFGTTWWGKRWLEALHGIDCENRIPRGNAYAGEGRVLRIELNEDQGEIKARVKGNYEPFYVVKIRLPQFTDAQKRELIKAISDSPAILAHLAAREVDSRIEKVAEGLKIQIFPESWQDLELSCSCPDTAVPCKHLAAVIYKISQEIDANPFVLFALKGLDLTAELRETLQNLDEAGRAEMPSWRDLLMRSFVPDEPLSPEYLRGLSFEEFPVMLDSLCGLFRPAPAGYAGGDLREIMRRTLSRAQKLAGAALRNRLPRQIPDWDSNEPLMRFNAWGQLLLNSNLTWLCTDETGRRLRQAATKDLSDDGVAHPLYEMYSTGIDKNQLADEPEQKEAMYHVWLIATKLVSSAAVIPQIFEPVEDFFSVRWIPAMMSADIARLTEQTGRALWSLPAGLLAFDRGPESLTAIDPAFIGASVLGAFIDSYVREAYKLEFETAQMQIRSLPEEAALFLGESIDTVSITSGQRVRMGLEAWLSNLYLDKLTVTPIIIFNDSLDPLPDSQTFNPDIALGYTDPAQSESGQTRVLPSPERAGAGKTGAGGDGSGADDTQSRALEVFSYDGQVNVDSTETVPPQEQRFSAKAGIGISMGFKRTDVPGTTAERFIPLKRIIYDDEFKSIRFECMRTVSRLSSICPQLETLLDSQDGEGTVRVQDLADVIQLIIPALRLLGVQMVIPRSLSGLLRLSTTVEADITGVWKRSSGLVGLESMMEYKWKLAIGNSVVDPTYFEELVKYEGQVVRFGSKFVYVDHKDLEEIGRQLKKAEERRKRGEPLVLKGPGILGAVLSGRYGKDKLVAGERLKDALKQMFESEETPLPQGIKATLRPYQQRGFDWLSRNAGIGIGSILADDMGLGKTLQLITLLEKLREDGRLDGKHQALVVAPVSLLSNWGREISKFAPELKYCTVHGLSGIVDPTAHVVLTSYGTLRSRIRIFKNLKFRLVAIDEAQNIKNFRSRAAMAVKEIDAEARIALSGTPVENRLLDYWSVMDFVNPGLLGNMRNFTREFAEPIEVEHDLSKAETFKRITSPFIMRRLKTDRNVIADLPEKTTTDRYCSLSREQAALYEAALKHSLSLLEEITTETKRRALVLTMMADLKKICNAPEQYSTEEPHRGVKYSGKGQVLLDLLDELWAARRKTLIFTQYIRTGELLQDWIFERFGYRPVFLNAKQCTVKERQAIVDEFEGDRRARCLIISTRAGGQGLNLVSASAVVHYDLWWNPAVEAQATDRAYRIGQTRDVLVYRLICAGTFEEKINALIESKKALAGMTVASGEKWLTSMSDRELRDLFTISDSLNQSPSVED